MLCNFFIDNTYLNSSVIFFWPCSTSKQHWRLAERSSDFPCIGSPLGLWFAGSHYTTNCSHSICLSSSKSTAVCTSLRVHRHAWRALANPVHGCAAYHPSIGTAILRDWATVFFFLMWTQTTMRSFPSLGHSQAPNMHKVEEELPKYTNGGTIYFLLVLSLTFINSLPVFILNNYESKGAWIMAKGGWFRQIWLTKVEIRENGTCSHLRVCMTKLNIHAQASLISYGIYNTTTSFVGFSATVR